MFVGPIHSRSFLALCLALFVSHAAQAERFTFHHEHILGTSLELQIEAESQQLAAAAETRILQEIERQRAIFSSYDDASELSRFLRTENEPFKLSRELWQVLLLSEEWRKRSGGAFNPGTEAISQVWQDAARQQSAPTPNRLKAAVNQAGEAHWRLDQAQTTAMRVSTTPLSFNAIAKGYIVEAACQAGMKDEAGIRGLLINLGGDLRVCGDLTQRVAIADPFHAEENVAPLSTIFVHDRAVATSGNYRRGFQIGDRWYSHLIDPRSGQPVDHVVSATVIAKSTADADALATICNVLSTAESIALVESQNAACLLVTREGKQLRSAGWDTFEQPQLYRFAAAVAGEEGQGEKKDGADKDVPTELLELLVKFELSRAGGAQYRRPYVAVWLEDANADPVRTALLFMTTTGNGSRWHRDLTRWYRQDNVRRMTSDVDLIGTISSASRGPGEYRAVFDGRDDEGKPLKPGKYMLLIEVAREHGTYQIIRQPLDLGARPIETTNLKPNVEVKSASFEYRQPAPKEKSK
jgi:thiamine biosynthesis lipoprotein